MVVVKNARRGFLLALLMYLSTVLVSWSMRQPAMLSSYGEIKTVDVAVYEDPGATVNATHIDWGYVENGSLTNKTLYLQNLSNVPCNLTMSTDSWDPAAAATYISLTWSYDYTLLDPWEIRRVTLTLHVSETVVGIDTFSFTIWFIAEG